MSVVKLVLHMGQVVVTWDHCTMQRKQKQCVLKSRREITYS